MRNGRLRNLREDESEEEGEAEMARKTNLAPVLNEPYPVTRHFRVLLQEVAEEGEKLAAAARIIERFDPRTEEYYDAMATVYVSMTALETKVPALRKCLRELEKCGMTERSSGWTVHTMWR